MIARVGRIGRRASNRLTGGAADASGPGEATVTQIELKGMESAAVDGSNADVFYQLGLLYSAGGDIPVDYVTAHKWFNIAAMRGNREAMRLRREVAELMSDHEIAHAQRAARDVLKPALKAA
jgi:TPR repeat protein